jgi:SpoVK/Ycf46/Vps4 family AAA+-type ATPase
MTDTPAPDLHITHLQAEVARIDVLVRRQVVRWQRAGEDPAESFRGLHTSDARAATIAHQRALTGRAADVRLSDQEERQLAGEYVRAADEANQIVADAHARGGITRLEHLVSTFGLTPFELDSFLICLAPALDLRYERLYAYLQDDVTRRRASVSLVLDLLCDDAPGERLPAMLRFGDNAPLVRQGLVTRISDPGDSPQPILSQGLAADEGVVTWLLGGFRPADEIRDHSRLSWDDASDSDQIVIEPVRAQLDQVASLDPRAEPVLALTGADLAGHESAARYLSAQRDRPLFRVDLAAAAGSGAGAPARWLRLALRDALLVEAVPYLVGWEKLTEGDARDLPAALTLVCDFPGLVLIGSTRSWQPSGVERDRVFLWVDLPIPEYGQRTRLWQHYLGSASEADGIQTPALAGQFLLTAGQIRDAVATARDSAARESRPVNQVDLFAAARSHSSPGLSGLARKINARYGWNDIVLPDDPRAQLREIVATVRGRPLVLEQWGVGRKLASSAGITILFAGPPGTGKTMAAEVIASELGLDLYKIDLSTIVSKYIGETEKNLERIFGEAQSSNAILFFDEADAIFGKRSEVKDAHDRYANIEVSYLLQRMEAYDGVTMLATNLRANLDEAFTRRLQFAVDFPFPEEEYRQRIWITLFPPDVPRADDLDFALLAHRFKLAGGNIRNIIVSAAYLAAADGGRVNMSHLFHGARREMQKMGRLVSERDLTPA